MGIEEGEGMQDKGIGNIVNKIVSENFPNLENEMPIQVQEVSRTQNRHDQNRTSSQHIIVKSITMENKGIVLKAIREKYQIAYNEKSSK
jgi:hypothetical protein